MKVDEGVDTKDQRTVYSYTQNSYTEDVKSTEDFKKIDDTKDVEKVKVKEAVDKNDEAKNKSETNEKTVDADMRLYDWHHIS